MRTRVMLFAAVLAFSCASIFGASADRATSPPARSASPKTGSHADRGQRPTSAEAQIRQVLDAQVAAWNRGDVDSFMTGYWKSPRTLFVGANGVTRGWQAVLDRYHRAYPNRAAMGQLTFSDLVVHQDCPDSAVVIGEYHLQRANDHPSGVFTLNFRKFSEGWRIVVDHTTAFAAAAQKP
jgi:ketosteroid isomerase-like protein